MEKPHCVHFAQNNGILNMCPQEGNETFQLLSQNRCINNDSVTQFIPWFFESFGKMNDVFVTSNAAILLAEALELITSGQLPCWEQHQRLHSDAHTCS